MAALLRHLNLLIKPGRRFSWATASFFLVVTLLAALASPSSAAPGEPSKEKERLEAAEWSYQMCRSTPPRTSGPCTKEYNEYQAALKAYRAAGGAP